MKTINLFGLTFLLLLCLTGCNEDNHETEYYNSIPGGKPFFRANTVQFHYVDKEGNNLIDKNNISTYPIPCKNSNAKPELPSFDENRYYASPFGAQVLTNQEGEDFFSLYFPGDGSSNQYTFYVYFKDTFDRFDLTYGYRNDAIGGDGWSATVLSLKINGKHVYADEECGSDYKVYINR